VEEKGETRAELKVSGMTCATCSATVESALQGVEGVSEARVNLGTETASVEYDPSKADLSEMVKAVKDAGYGVVSERVALKVGGMTCATCVATVGDAIRDLEGVFDANVNLGAERAYVTYSPKVAGLEDMKNAIENVGYQYLGVVGEETEELEKALIEKDLREKRNRIVVGFVVGAFLMALGLSSVKLSIPLSYVMLIVSLPVFFYLSRPIFSAGFRALKNRSLNMDVMYSMGIGVAFLSSLLGTFEIVLSPEFMFYETAIFLASFLTLGRYLETRAKGRTSEAIKKLMVLQPKTAVVMRRGVEEEIPAEALQKGDIVVVKPGEKVPADGIVVDGESYVDESMISGEPVPVFKTKGNEVVGGTLNKNGVLRFEATKIGKETAIAQIISLVEEAQGSRPPIQRVADRAVTYFIPTVLTIAALTFFAWYLVFGDQVSGDALLFALTATISVLVVACPCALGLATPTAVTVGLGRAAEMGVLIKGGESLEISEKLDTVVFDKTGTLTVGRPEVTDFVSFGRSDKELATLAAGAEQSSEHPLAEAVVRWAQAEGLSLPSSSKFHAFEGMGVVAEVEGKNVVVGNRIFFENMGIERSQEAEEKALSLEEEGKTAILVAADGQLAGIVAVADTLKGNSAEAVENFKDMGFGVVMLTGDNPRSASVVGDQIGIDRVLAEVLPQDKAQEIRRLQESGRVVAFVGDGINDAPALAQANVGIAIGSGTDVAIESGEVVLIRDDLMDAVAAVQLSRKVMSRVKLNLFWAFAYNTALIPVAAGVLYPFFGIKFRPEFAGLAMALSSVTVVTLSLMLKGYIPPAKKVLRGGHKEKRTGDEIEERDGEQVREIGKFEGVVETLVIDPVCNMEVDPKTAQFKTEYMGETYYFCSPGCKKAFEKEPEKYLNDLSDLSNLSE